MFATENQSKAPRRFFSAFFNRATSQKYKKTQSCADFLKKEACQKVSCMPKSAEELQHKFEDCAWGLTYQKNKKTLIFDLDNTLIYASKHIPENYKYTSITFEKDGQYLVRYIVKRPGLLKFLKGLSKNFNICVFTSAEEQYARKIIETTKISKYIYTVYDRSHCDKINDFLYLKNIWTLGFEQKQAVLIDDFVTQKQNQPDNCIHIKSFEGEAFDRELYTLYPFLRELSETDDVRPVQQHYREHVDKLSQCQEQTQKIMQEYEDYGLELDEGCRKSFIRTFKCHPSILKTNVQALISSTC